MQRKSMLIKISTLLLACCLLLCGCTTTGISDNSSRSNIELPTPSEPIQILSCFNREDADKTKTAPEMIDIGNGEILTFEYNYADGDENKITTTTIKRIDIVKDTVCCQNVLEGTFNSFGKCSSDNIWLMDTSAALLNNVTLYMMDSELNIVKEMSLPSINGIISDDYKTFYYLDRSLLVALDVDTKETDYIELPHGLRFSVLSGYDLETNSIYGIVDVCNEEAGAIMNVDDKTLRLFSREFVYNSMCGSMYYGSTYDNDKQQRLFYRGNLDNENLQFFTLDASDTYRYDFITGSGYLQGNRIVGKGESYYKASKVDTRICRFSDDSIEYCDLNSLGIESYLSYVLYMPNRQCLVGSANIDGIQKIVLINVNLLNYEKKPLESKKVQNLVDSKLWEENEKMFAIPEVSPELDQARIYAYEIEKKHGVKILMSNQCSVISKKKSYSGCQFVTTDNLYTGISENERIMESLEQLDDALSQYPENFFEKFHTYSHLGGLRFLLVGNIDSGDFGAVGFADSNDEWYDAFIDISYDNQNITRIYHHETWHNIEDLCKHLDATSFTDEDWAKLNPENYSPITNDTIGIESKEEYLCYNDTTNDYYFTDSYAMTNNLEDRACLFEYVMTPDLDTEIVTSSPYTKAKFKVMVDTLRRILGDSAWDIAEWEEALKSAETN